MDERRIGVLGLGRIGSMHARHLRDLDGVDEVLVHDVDGDLVDAFVAGSRDGVSAASDHGEVFDRADAVVICTPTAQHPAHVAAVAAAGLPIFCEKPISLDLAETDDAITAADEAGVLLQVGFQRRFEAGHVEAKRRIDAGELGDVYLIRTAGHDHEPPHESYLPESGSIFRDLHIHEFDAIAWLSGQTIDEVYATGSVLVDEMFARHGDVDTTAMVVRLSGGSLALMSGARHDPLGYDHRTEVFGSKDSVCAGWTPRTPMRSVDPDGLTSAVDPYPSFPVRFEPAYRNEIAAFVAAVATGARTPCPGSTAREALRAGLAADRSLAEHRPVSLSEI